MIDERPNWKDAPLEADWLVQEYDGTWWWIEGAQPIAEGFRWSHRGDSTIAQGSTGRNLLWKETIEKRPENIGKSGNE